MFDRFVGLPWRDGGRDATGYDCWGLLRLAFEQSRGVILPSYSEAYEGVADREAVAALFDAGRAAWAPVAAGGERPWDVVLLHHRPWHVGIVVGAGRMLHIPHGGQSLIEPYTARNLARRIEGFYRYEASA